MESRMDKPQGRGLELWRALSDEFDSQAADMLDAKMKLYPSPARASNIDDLDVNLDEWEQIGRDPGIGCSSFAVPEITKGIALSQLVPTHVEHQLVLAPDKLKTFSQKIK